MGYTLNVLKYEKNLRVILLPFFKIIKHILVFGKDIL
ncbi:MAG: hypothetical protein QT11_C0001G0513 [archaeon GW2011_AR20]|nr:MAG: hypothetical protein QT11_C0001G0513 [archaeon GW2011_AR20]